MFARKIYWKKKKYKKYSKEKRRRFASPSFLSLLLVVSWSWQWTWIGDENERLENCVRNDWAETVSVRNVFYAQPSEIGD